MGDLIVGQLGAETRDAISAALGSPVARASRVHGGDVHDAFRLELGDGRTVFAKTSPRAPADLFAAEARGLRWLAVPGAPRVPAVLAHRPRFLALEWIERGAPAPDAAERLGRGLAALHRHGAPSFGLDRPNYLATIPQDNAPAPDWPTFYGERRLLPLLERALARGCAPARLSRGIERVVARLPELAGPPEPPARLHGDLWSGNLLHDAAGAPVLVDPAAYGGHREVDLAMMRLFGGFAPRVFAAYDEAFPLAPGHPERVPLYQLLPLLAHVVLFGAGYLGSLESALDSLA